MPQFVKNLSNLRPIEVNADGTASFELDMDLLEQSSRIFLYKVSERTQKSDGYNSACSAGNLKDDKLFEWEILPFSTRMVK